MHIIRRISKMGACLIVLLPSLIVLAPQALARPIICSAGNERYSIPTSSKSVKLNNNVIVVTVPPGGSATKTVTTSSTYAAGISVTTGASAEAGIVFAKASASVSMTLHASGSRTQSQSTSITTNNNTGGYHDYIFFDGERTAKGTWKKERCGVDGTQWITVGTGNWNSWNIQLEGAVRCDQDSVVASNYGTDSPQYFVAKMC